MNEWILVTLYSAFLSYRLRGNSKPTRGRNGFCARGKFHLPQLFKLKWFLIWIELCKFFLMVCKIIRRVLKYTIHQENKAIFSKITIVLVCICHFKNIIMLNIVMYTLCYTVYIKNILQLQRGFLTYKEHREQGRGWINCDIQFFDPFFCRRRTNGRVGIRPIIPFNLSEHHWY